MSTNQLDATALTENAINWLNKLKNVKILFNNSKKEKSEIATRIFTVVSIYRKCRSDKEEARPSHKCSVAQRIAAHHEGF